jgi:2'-5' RNA ligase
MEASAEARQHEGDENWRVFCALELPPEIAQQATDHINRLRRQFPWVAASWNRDGAFHITLKFIGAMPHSSVARFSLATERATRNVSSFVLSVQGSGAFPAKGTPRVLWLGIDDISGDLGRLQSQLEEECAAEGFAKDERTFHAHLTLARFRRPQGTRELAAAHKSGGFAAIEFLVSELLVIRSELSNAGSKYSVISRHPLQSGQAGVHQSSAFQ